MRKLLLILIWCVAGGCATAAAQRPRPEKPWLTYVSPDHRFSLQFPNGIRERQIRYDRDLPYLIGTMVEYVPSPDKRFEISWVDYLGAIGDPAEFKRSRIQSFVEAATSHAGTLIGRTHVNTAGCQGEEAAVRMTNPENKIPSLVKVRYYSSAGNIFYLEYFGNSDSPAEKAIADRYMNSFKVFGGCHDLISVPPGVNPMIWFSGSTDHETGWHRVDSPYGISFLVPSPGSLRWVDEPYPVGIIRHYTYEFRAPGYLFNVEIFDGYKAAGRATPAQRKLELDRYLAATKKELATGGYIVGECTAIGTGDRAGYDCGLKLTGNEMSGHAAVFVSPTRNYMATAFRYNPGSDEAPILQFLASLEIGSKILQSPSFSGN
jgi:hypothetical protein